MKKTSLRTRAAPGFSDFQVAGSEEEEEDEAEKDLQVFFSSFLSLFVLFPSSPSPHPCASFLHSHLRQLLFENEGGIVSHSYLI